jgi:Ricin-type beta-trefoil lectin domain-like
MPLAAAGLHSDLERARGMLRLHNGLRRTRDDSPTTQVSTAWCVRYRAGRRGDWCAGGRPTEPGANDITPAVPQSVTQPASPLDPSPVDGESYYLINQASGLQADLDGNAVVENARSITNLSQRWAMTKAPDGNWLISNVGNGLCLDSSVVDAVPWTVQTRCRTGVATQQWSLS